MLSVTAAGQHEQNYLNDGWGAAQKYLKMEGGEEHPDARKWAGIILGSVADFYKPKEKVAASQEIRQHLEACLAVNPGDSAAQHAMGMYCFNVAGIGCVRACVFVGAFLVVCLCCVCACVRACAALRCVRACLPGCHRAQYHTHEVRKQQELPSLVPLTCLLLARLNDD